MKRFKKYGLIAATAFGLCVLGGSKLTTEAAWEAEHYDIRTAGGAWDGTHYMLKGEIMKNIFFCDGTHTYFLQADGTAMKNRLTYHPDGEHIIYFDAQGHEVFDAFTHVDKGIGGETIPEGDIYFFNTFGYMYKDVLTYDQTGTKLYYANGNGVMEHNGWFRFSNGEWGFANWDGSLIKDQWSYRDGYLVYHKGDGHLATGVIEDWDNYYVLDSDYGYCTEVIPKNSGVVPDMGTDDDNSTDNSTDTDNNNSSDNTTTDKDSPYTVLRDENGNVYDLGGMEIIIRDWWSGGVEVEPTNAYEEAREEYHDWLEETYNFTIKEMAISDWGSVPDDFAEYVTGGGDDSNYVFALRQGAELANAMRSGLLMDVSKLGVFDFTEDKWINGVHNLFSKGTSVYGFKGGEPEPRGGIYFNKRLLEEAGINPQDIYDWQEAGEWTWEKFEEICKFLQRDYDNDGVIDVYGMANFANPWYSFAVYSNNGDFIGMENGKYVNALEKEETLEALNWALDMWDTYDAHVAYPEDATWDYWNTAYVSGMAVFNVDECYKAGQFKDMGMEDDFGFVCFPKGPKADDYTNSYSDNVYAIPACYDADKAWKIAFAYELYTDPIPGYEDYSTVREGYSSSFCDEESVELTVNRLLQNGRVTYHIMVPGIDLGSQLLWTINKDNLPAQQAEVIRDTWDKYIEEANNW